MTEKIVDRDVRSQPKQNKNFMTYESMSNGQGISYLLSAYPVLIKRIHTVMILSFQTDRSGQTVQTKIRLLLEEQSDQGLHCLLFHLNLFEEIP